MLTPTVETATAGSRLHRTVVRAVFNATPKLLLVASHAATLALFALATRGANDSAALLTIVVLGLAASCGATMTDSSGNTTAVAVVSLRRRTAIRIACSIGMIAASAAIATWIAVISIEEPVAYSVWCLHGLALCSLSFAVCARRARKCPETHVEAGGAAAVVLVFAFTKALSFRFPSWPDVGRDHDAIVWYGVLIGSLVGVWHNTRDYADR